MAVPVVCLICVVHFPPTNRKYFMFIKIKKKNEQNKMSHRLNWNKVQHMEMLGCGGGRGGRGGG